MKILKKPKVIYSPGFFFSGSEKMLKKVIHLKVNEKRN